MCFYIVSKIHKGFKKVYVCIFIKLHTEQPYLHTAQPYLHTEQPYLYTEHPCQYWAEIPEQCIKY